MEVDLSKPLLGNYLIKNRTFYVEYESLENICFTCGHFGHKLDACPSSKTSTNENGGEIGNVTAPIPHDSKAATGLM
ncbi:hypothetical protein LINPERPRIM_LOCUS14675 [Linum perenne]